MNNILKTTKSGNGNEINLYGCSQAVYKKTILFIGCMHGDEAQGFELIMRFLQSGEWRVESGELGGKNNSPLSTLHSPLKKNNRLLFVPCLNPDGVKNNTRQNARGVDLNRNFPTKNWEKTEKNEFYGGESPNSEKETQFMVEVIADYKPDVILTFHAPFKIVNYDGPAEKIAQNIAGIINYPVQKDIGYQTPGSFGTYCGVELNIPTITLELDENEPIETLWERCKDIFSYLAAC